MAEVRGRNVQSNLRTGIRLIQALGLVEQTRNGPAVVVPEPVLTITEQPMERVLLNPARDANPFFHLMEAFWMLAGREDVKSISRYSTGIKPFSDNGVTFHGAYGRRWRWGWDDDQLKDIIHSLRQDRSNRRLVLTMWNPDQDLRASSLDLPCNTHVYFRVRSGSVLDMTVCCRSNDAIWGCYGANAVHFSVLQEFVAAASGLQMGHMYQLSNNLHAYVDVMDKLVAAGFTADRDVWYYEAGIVHATSLFNPRAHEIEPETLLRDLTRIWESIAAGHGKDPGMFLLTTNQVLSEAGFWTLQRMHQAWENFKTRQRARAMESARLIPASDWSRACHEWLERRYTDATA